MNARPHPAPTALVTGENRAGEQPRRGVLFVAGRSDRFPSSVGAAWSRRCRPDGALAVSAAGDYKEAAPTELTKHEFDETPESLLVSTAVHPGPLPQERKSRTPACDNPLAPISPMRGRRFPLSPGEGLRPAGRVRASVCLTISPTCQLIVLLLALLLAGCAAPKETPQQRAEAARALFDQTTKNFHLPSAEAHGAERDRLLAGAASGYEQLIKQYPEQTHACAQALRSLGNVRASQGRLDDAVKLYASVARKYPAEDWEILTSWKSAADLLAEAGRAAEAKPYYEKILARFDRPDAPAVVKTIVRGSRARLTGEARREP